MIINPVQSRVAHWRIIFSCGEQLTFHQSSLMSRNSHRNKNGKFDQILSNWVNVNGFDDFGQFFRQICQNKICSAKLTNCSQIDWSEINSAHLIITIDEFLPFLLLHEFLDITTLTNFNHVDLINGGQIS